MCVCQLISGLTQVFLNDIDIRIMSKLVVIVVPQENTISSQLLILYLEIPFSMWGGEGSNSYIYLFV